VLHEHRFNSNLSGEPGLAVCPLHNKMCWTVESPGFTCKR